jgi:predicted membrane-bound spermidine synthase
VSVEAQGRRRLAVVGAAFLVSGASALVYQVAWQRILALHSGVSIYSISMIVGAFMAGLGLGSLAGGWLSARTAPRRSLAAFAAIELLIALLGATSSSLYYDLLYLKAAHLYAEPWRAGLLHFASLLLPTGLMGMSLPFLVRAMVRDTESAARMVGYLYGVNVVGAGLGGLLGPWVLMRFLGIRDATFVAAGGNLVAGLLALCLARAVPEEDPAASARSVPKAGPTAGAARPFALWLGLYTLSGFVALSLEILWFRLVEVAVKSTAFTFGTVLAIYLMGLALGSLLGAARAERFTQPLRAFLTLQGLIAAYAAGAIVILLALPETSPALRWLTVFWATRATVVLGSDWDVPALLRLYVAFPVALFGPPTVLMGLSFTALQRAVHDDPRTSGRKVGLLQAGNIAGCVAGSLVIGLVALGSLGTTGTLRVLVACGLAFALLGLRLPGSRARFAALAAALAVLAVAIPSQERLWRRLHGKDRGPAFVGEDATGVVALTDRDGRWALAINGKTHSWLPFGGIHTFLGALPVLVHPEPGRVAVIGLGSGDTAWASGCRRETASIEVFEICGPVAPVLRQAALADLRLRELRSFFGDGRYALAVADGRNAVETRETLYDVIEADALWPESAFSGNLYSLEFFERCSRRLASRGIMCTWAPTARVVATFRQAFPHVVSFADILLGSRDPIDVDLAGWVHRSREADVVAYLGEARLAEVRARMSAGQALPVPSPTSDINRDLDPRDEFLRK